MRWLYGQSFKNPFRSVFGRSLKSIELPPSSANENLYSTVDGASALPPARRELDDLKEKDDDLGDGEDEDDDIDAAKKSAVSNFLGSTGGSAVLTKSSSTSNLAPNVKSIAKKFSFGKIGRKISDLHVSI